jgi:anion-transporting  ArsA/GET3 family ATPase
MTYHPILDRRLLFVTGKGGVGKTVAAATIALLAFRHRKRVLVVELSPYGRMRELLGGPETGTEPVEILPRLEAVRIDPRHALEEFLDGLLRIRALTQRLLRSSSFSILTAAAPGIEEFLVLARIAAFESARVGIRRRPRYDLIVVDAQATGHSLPFLSTARTVMEMMPTSSIGKMASEVGTLLSDAAKTAVVLVTIPEEMAVNETIELAASLRQGRAVALGPLIANAVWPSRFDEDETGWLGAVAGDDPLVQVGRYHLEKRRRAEEQLERLREELRVDPIRFPFVLTRELDRPHLRRLVSTLDAAIPRGASDG